MKTQIKHENLILGIIKYRAKNIKNKYTYVKIKSYFCGK